MLEPVVVEEAEEAIPEETVEPTPEAAPTG
jgi:hypothetical protein